MEFILLTIWKGIVIFAALLFLTIVFYRSASVTYRFFKRISSPRKRSSSTPPRTKTASSYSTPVMDKI